MNKIRRDVDVDGTCSSSLREGVETITPEMLTLVALDQRHIDTIVQTVPGGAANIQDVYPLSSLQEGILFHRLLNEQNDTYVLSTLLEMQSEAHVGALVHALQNVIDRHDILRTAVLWERLPRPVQVVYRKATLHAEQLALDPDRDALAQMKELMTPVRQVLDLCRAPLLRLRVAAERCSGRWYGLLQIHHVICDHQSLRALVAEAVDFLGGREQQLPSSVPYRSYVAQQLALARPRDEEVFFRGKLGDVDEPTAPFGLLEVHGNGIQIEEAHHAIEPGLAHQIRSVARRLGVSAARMFHAAWALVVARTSGRDDVVFGTVLLTAGQRSARSQRMLGLSINTLPLRVRLQNVSAVELVRQTHRELLELLAYEAAPLTLAQRCSSVAAATPLFTSLLNYRRSLPDSNAEAADAAGVRVLGRGEAWTNYPIALTVDDSGDAFVLMTKTDRSVDPRCLAMYAQTAIRSLVTALDEAPQTAALALPVLPQEEWQRVIGLFNATQAGFPEESLIHELFEARAAASPEAVAVVYESQSLTYEELNSRANQLARHLSACGLGPDEPVGIFVERSVELVLGLLGILKAGAAYLPLDSNSPTERLQQILEDARPKVLLTQQRLRGKLPEHPCAVIVLDDWRDLATYSTANLDSRRSGLASHHLAYVMYTSGSTGRPKGVMVEHGNVLSLWQGLEQIYRQSPRCERIGVNASFNFDASVKQLIQLLSGRTVVLIPQELRWDAPLLLSYARRHRIEGIDCTPGQLRSWLTAGLLDADAHTLRVVLVGGEAIDVELWNKLAQCSGIRFYNVYGPTESTVDATFAQLMRDMTAPHIGRPMENRSIYILNHHRQPVPIGVAGEIYIGGAGVARGYLNLPALTAERFLPDPFSAEPQARVYKTGDLGRWRADGTIEYVGRNDFQLKVRGFRIEAGEIETQLLNHQRVNEAVVVAREDVPGEERLIAYLVASDPSSVPDAQELRAHLKAVLPEYMVPSAFVMLEGMPLTPNGKVDRRALPIPDLEACASRAYEPTQNETEETVAGIWRSLLRVERVGRHDNFFELGGHSLLVVQMIEQLRQFGLSAEVRQVFESPSVAEFASVVAGTTAEQLQVSPNLIPPACEEITPRMLTLVELEAEHIERIVQAVPGGATNVQDIYPLTALQEGILFHHLLNKEGGDPYVVRTLLSVSSRPRLEELVAALQSVIDRHDVLRTAVLAERLPQPVQVVYRRATLPVLHVTLSSDRDALEQVSEWLKPERQRLDLRQAPLMRLQVAADHAGRWYALLQVHHIVDDAVSLDLVVSEVVARLQGRVQRPTERQPYRNHVAQALSLARARDAETFFRGKLGDIEEPTAPFGLMDVHGDGTQIEETREEIEAGVSRRARAQARRLGVSAATLFHAAWGLVVGHTSGQDDVVFGTVLLGRLHGGAGAQQTLGMFINTLPLRLRLQGVSAKELVEQTQRELVELFSHEQTSLAVAQRCSGISGSTPLFSALLNFRHGSRSSGADWNSAEGIRLLARHGFTNYPITLSVDDLGQGFALTAQTDRRVDPRRLTKYLQTAVQSLVEALEQSAQTPALQLRVMPEGERRRVIELFNAAQADYPQQKLIHELFEAQAARTPGAVAALYESRSLTYAELNGRANQLARYLRERGIGPDQPVGICVERSVEMVLGLLAILKAGGAYVPLDPNYPTERLHYMLEDAAPRVVLTQKKLRASVPATRSEVIDLDDTLERIEGYDAHDLPTADLGLTSQNLLYLIYTSGSTGQPKGTAMPHRSMVNLLEWHRQNLPAGEGQRVLQFAALSFDVAFQETFSTLCAGGTLVLLDEWVRRDARALAEFLSKQSIHRLFVPPLMLQGLAEHCKTTSVDLASLQDVITAGEQLRISPEIVSFFERLEGCRLHNHYGPTETHVVTALTMSGSPRQWPALPTIGRPISNTQIYVLDDRRQPVPIGVAGEIYIGGANLARGYLNRPQLTAQRFVADPFSTDPQARLYKTGDLGRWSSDGMLEYLGRNDDQVKIRGYRIELGEIEAQLVRHQCVKEAAIVAREDVPGHKRLVAYVTARDEGHPSAEELRAFLRAALPEYMVPSAFVMLESLPVTPSGKLNRRALPAPDLAAYASQQYEPAQGEVEQALAQIWQELLHLDRVGRDDNFFDLGGHSLLVLKVLFRINQALGSVLKVTDVYNSPTIRQLAGHIGGVTVEDELVDLSREAVLDTDIVPSPGVRCAPAQAIMLTGGTGFVGRFLLRQLLEATDATIYCLVRARSKDQASFRIRTTLAKWDLWRDEYEPRIVALPGDLRLPRLGMDERTYQIVAHAVDRIHHCATSMNHLETYTMAKAANVASATELVRLATHAKPKLINYISTLGVFSSSTLDGPRVVDEASSIDAERHWQSRGYVASKWVGEKIFMVASDRGIPCNIFRLGLVWADTQHGRYDELQRGYRILKSSLLSGYGIRNYQFEMPPTPIDYVARAVVALADRYAQGQGIFHISSPRQMTEGVFEQCSEILGTPLELVSFYDWIGEMKRLHGQGISMPVTPLIEFAFSMDEDTFHQHQRRIRARRIRFDCERTYRELECAGIAAPVLTDALLGTCVEDMLARDAELHAIVDSANDLIAHHEQMQAIARRCQATQRGIG